MRDADGNRVDFTYNGSNQLTKVGETGGSARNFSLTYTTWNGGANTEVDVADPAGRVTKYQEDTAANNYRLLHVVNPDNSALHYTWGGCGGSGDQLCTAKDPNGSTVSFSYAAAALGPAQASQITDRRGIVTSIAYASGTTTVTKDPSKPAAGQEVRRYALIDSLGRVGEADAGDGTGTWLHVVLTTYDTAGCRQPDAAVDNDACDIVRPALNNGATPDRHTTYKYGDEGSMLVQRDCMTAACNTSADLLTTAGLLKSVSGGRWHRQHLHRHGGGLRCCDIDHARWRSS